MSNRMANAVEGEQFGIFVPTREEVESLHVGGLAPNVFGRWERVTEIHAQRDDIHGKAFVCYYTRYSDTGTLSGSMKEGELVRSSKLINDYTSAQLSEIEANAKAS